MPILTYDGSYIGRFDRSIIEWYCPTTTKTTRNKFPALYVCIRFNNELIAGILEMDRTKKEQLNIQVLADELKPLFGLKKIGYHKLIINCKIARIIKTSTWLYPNKMNIKLIKGKTNFYFKRADYTLDVEGRPIFTKHEPINTITMLKHKNELQQITIFRYLLKINTKLVDILVNEYELISINELKTRFSISTTNYDVKIFNKDIIKFLFPKRNSIKKVLGKMTGLMKNNYFNRNKSILFKDKLIKIFLRIEPDFIQFADEIYNDIYDKLVI